MTGIGGIGPNTVASPQTSKNPSTNATKPNPPNATKPDPPPNGTGVGGFLGGGSFGAIPGIP